MKLAKIKKTTAERLLTSLDNDLRYKLQYPRMAEIADIHFGDTELARFAHALWVIAYVRAFSATEDGNWVEFLKWMGMTDKDMIKIEKVMRDAGWVEGCSEF